MSEDLDDPFAGIGEKDRIRKPTRLTLAQIGIMAAAVSIVIISAFIALGLIWIWNWRLPRASAILAAGLGLGYSVYQTHWRYRQKD